MNKRYVGRVASLVLGLLVVGRIASAATTDEVLTRLDFSVVGVGLAAGPDYQAVPKGIATQVTTGIDAQGFDVDLIVRQLPKEYRVKAELSGPAFPIPLTLTTLPGRPFDIPTLALLGKHTLNNIRLVDGGGQTLFGAVPQAVVIESISDPLITQVTTRPLTLVELQERGVTFDETNFTAYEFTAVIALSSGQVPLTLPVLIPNKEPRYEASFELPPSIGGLSTPQEIKLPPQVQNASIEGFMLEEEREDPEEKGTGVGLPPIPGVLVIPGNIGFLHQYFSALAIVTNGAPGQSNLTVTNVQARLILPPGANLTADSDEVPDDDPLRMASNGLNSQGVKTYFPRTMPVVNVGPDGKGGTADDRVTLNPAESGQADFTIEGLKEGTHKLDFEITATLEGLPIGPVRLKGRASGAVLVRNPNFSVTLGHPETIRSGEAYDLFVTITNTGASIANLVSLRLDPRALSGAVFAANENADKQIETILPGSAATIKYRMVAQRTGKVTATAFASEEITGHFTLRVGVGELGIPLSPDSLILPYTGSLNADLVTAAVGLLGQAWSVATAPAGALPADVLPIGKLTITRRANALSEAGLRRLLGEGEGLAAGDLVYDFFGSDQANRAFDALRRRSSQGLEFNRALGATFGAEVAQSGVLDFQRNLSERSSYRVAQLSVITTSSDVRLQLSNVTGQRTGGLANNEAFREIPYADALPLTNSGAVGTLLLASKLESGDYRLDLRAATTGSFALGVVLPDSNGVLQQLSFSNIELAANGRATLLLSPGSAGAGLLQIDSNADGVIERTLEPTAIIAIPDPPPAVTVAVQVAPGFGPGGDKHGRNVALLFNERVTEASAEEIANYAVDANGVDTVRLQASGRMAFVLLKAGIGPFFPRTLTVAGLLDDQGQSLPATTLPIRTTAQGPAASVQGAVRLADGTPVAGVSVRLLQLKMIDDGIELIVVPVIIGETRADAEGRYQFDYVLRDNFGPFTVQALRPESTEIAAITASVAYDGQAILVDLFMKARGSVNGTVRDAKGAPMANASVLLMTLTDQRSFVQTTDSAGLFSFAGVSVGTFSLKAVSQALYAEGATMGILGDDGSAVTQDVTIYKGAEVTRGTIFGVVSASDGTAKSGVLVKVETIRYPNGLPVTVYANWCYADDAGRYAFAGVYTGKVRVTASDRVSGEKGEVIGELNTGESLAFNVILQGIGRITGQVVREDGLPVSGVYLLARVGQVERYVVPETDGSFILDGVLVGGNVMLDLRDGAGRLLAQGAVALLSAGETVYAELFVSKSVVARASIVGRVFGLDGKAVGANIEVRRLVDTIKYFSVRTDLAGQYRFDDLPLGNYRLVSLKGREIANTTVELLGDGQVKEVDLLPFGIGTVTGTIYDENSGMMPVGADVRLFGGRLDPVGWLNYDSRAPIATIKSDAQTGRYSFSGVYAGSFSVQASSLFRPTPVAATGTIMRDSEVVTADLVLKDTFGSISGQVLLPDGTPAPAEVRVWVLLGNAEVAVTTDSAGKFAFRPILPAAGYFVTAEDLATTLTARGGVSVAAGRDVALRLQLLGRGTLTVRALNPPDPDGKQTVAPDVVVKVKGSAFPYDWAQGTTDSSGAVTFGNLAQGRYTITAVGYPDRGGRSEGTIVADLSVNHAEVTLAPYGTVVGRFVKADGVTPVVGGQVTLTQNNRILVYALSSSDPATAGSFRMEYVPLGDFTLEGFDPVSERVAKGGGRMVENGATVTADVVVVPRGTVKGVLLNYSGTTPISNASISIRSAGALDFRYTAASAPDGSFLFAGVPAGVFTIEATDPVNRLKGTASGTLSYEGQLVEVETHIAPSGQIEGRVLLPDGVTPSAVATVELGGVLRVADPVSGYYFYTELAAGHSYTLKARESNSKRFGSAIATLTRDGQITVANIVLRGNGVVKGLVFDTNTTSPLGGALISLLAAEGVYYDSYSDPDGSFSFSNVPAGAFRLTARHQDRLTAAAAVSGVLSQEGEIVSADLTFGKVASLTGTVLLPDARTPARGGVVRLSSAKGNFIAVIDSEGRYLFDRIPLCTFQLTFEDASGTAINQLGGALAVNGETQELGTVILDDKPISVIASDPADGVANVAVNATIKIKFSEPAQPSTITPAHIKVLKGTTPVIGSLLLDEDNAGVTFVPDPQHPLVGFTLYTVVVTTGVKDRVDRPLASTWSSTFTTIDNLPPTIVVGSSSPANGAAQITPEGVVRLTFSEAVDANHLDGLQLKRGITPVAAIVSLIPGGTVAILTPKVFLDINASYTVTANGLWDSVGNVQILPYSATFATIDTIVPTVDSLTVPNTALLIQGQMVTVSATVTATDVALVDFYVDDVRVATDNSAPYSYALLLNQLGTLRLKAIAQDRVDNRGPATPLELEVVADQPPTVSIVSPAVGSTVNTGALVTVQVQGTDDVEVTEFILTATGAMVYRQPKPPTGQPAPGQPFTASFTFTVPTDADPAQTIDLSATAKDGRGQLSMVAQRSLTVQDSIVPTLSLSSPGSTVRYKPGETGIVILSAADNIGVTAFNCTASGAAVGGRDWSITPARQAQESFSFQVGVNAVPHAAMRIDCTARDAAGKSDTQYLDLIVADVVPPVLQSLTPTDGDSELPTNIALVVVFDEALNLATVMAESVPLFSSAGEAVTAIRTLSSDGRTLTVRPQLSLRTGQSYTLRVLTTVTDLAGNGLPQPVTMSFATDGTPPVLLQTTPVAGSWNVSLGTAVSLTFNEPLDATSIQVRLAADAGAVAMTAPVLAADRKTVTFYPVAALEHNGNYTATLLPGVRDLSGNVLATATEIRFRTVSNNDVVPSGLWHFDGDWQDASGNANHGTAVNGAAFSSPGVQSAQAAEFNSVNNSVQIQDSPSLHASEEITIAGWFNVASFNETRQSIFWKGDAPDVGDPTDENREFSMGIHATGSLSFTSTSNDTVGMTQSEVTTAPGLIVADRWYNFAAVINSRLGYMMLFLDGQEVASGPYNGAGIRDTVGPLLFGANPSGESALAGWLDEMAIYRVALAPEEIQERYLAGLTGDRTPPEPLSFYERTEVTLGEKVLLAGTKESGASLRINGTQVVTHDLATTWQALYPLSLGENSLEITSRDPSGNSTLPAVMVVERRPSDVVGRWHMDGDWLDSSGNNRNGRAVGGLTFAEGPLAGSRAGSFDGEDDQVTVQIDSGVALPANNFSFEFWANPGSIRTSTVEANAGISGAGESNRQLALFPLEITSESTAAGAGVSVGTDGISVYEGAALYFPSLLVHDAPLTGWHHIVVVYNDKTPSLYIDGTFVKTGLRSQRSNVYPRVNFSDPNPSTGSEMGSYKGQLGEVSIYNRSLSATDVAVAYRSATSVMTLTMIDPRAAYRSGVANYAIDHGRPVEWVICTASGAASGVTRDFPPPEQTSVSGLLDFTVAPEAGEGTSMALTCTAMDDIGQLKTTQMNLSAAENVVPFVAATSISNGDENVSVAATLGVTFSEAMAAESITPEGVELRNWNTERRIDCSIAWEENGQHLVVTPTQLLDFDATYDLWIDGSLTDLAGNRLASTIELLFSTQNANAVVNFVGNGTSSNPGLIPAGNYGTLVLDGSSMAMNWEVIAESLVLRNGSTLTVEGSLELPGDLTLSGGNVMVDGYISVGGQVTLDNLSTLNTSNLSGSLEITATSLLIDATSKIDVTATGYAGGTAGGSGTTLWNLPGSTFSAGGSHGGLGGISGLDGSAVNGIYADMYYPISMGSGAGGHSTTFSGGNGGGQVTIKVQSMLLDGVIRADGGAGADGGGSGGGVYIEAGSIAGNGEIRACGGNVEMAGGGAGGGGRIAIFYETLELPRGNILAHGGQSFDGLNAVHNGGAGTVLLYAHEQWGGGELIVDNGGILTADGSTPLPSIGRGTISAVTPYSLSVTEPRWQEGSFEDLYLYVRPNLEVSSLFTVCSNTATTLTLCGWEGEMTDVAVGSTFSGVYRFDAMTVSGGARVDCGDLVEIVGTLTVDNASLVSGGTTAGTLILQNGGTLSP